MIEKIDKAVDAISGACSMALASDEHAWEERKKRLGLSETSGKHRLAALALHTIVRTRPKIIRSMLTRPYEKRGIEVIGMGYSSTVIRMGDTVMKIIRDSERMSEEQQRDYVKKFQISQDVLLNYLGDYAIPQEFKIAEHPLKPKGFVVSTQPYIEGFSPLRINNANFCAGLGNHQKCEISNFTNKAYEMVNESGWVPDILGVDNFGFRDNGSSFVIVDTIPSPVRTPPDMSIEYLDRVAAAVQ